jgi:hypothetical protein
MTRFPHDDWISLHDAATRCRVSRGTMRDWARDAYVPAQSVSEGRRMVIYWPWVARHLSQPATGQSCPSLPLREDAA